MVDKTSICSKTGKYYEQVHYSYTNNQEIMHTDFYVAYVVLLCAKGYSKCFTPINSFNHCNGPYVYSFYCYSH